MPFQCKPRNAKQNPNVKERRFIPPFRNNGNRAVTGEVRKKFLNEYS